MAVNLRTRLEVDAGTMQKVQRMSMSDRVAVLQVAENELAKNNFKRVLNSMQIAWAALTPSWVRRKARLGGAKEKWKFRGHTYRSMTTPIKFNQSGGTAYQRRATLDIRNPALLTADYEFTRPAAGIGHRAFVENNAVRKWWVLRSECEAAIVSRIKRILVNAGSSGSSGA